MEYWDYWMDLCCTVVLWPSRIHSRRDAPLFILHTTGSQAVQRKALEYFFLNPRVMRIPFGITNLPPWSKKSGRIKTFPHIKRWYKSFTDVRVGRTQSINQLHSTSTQNKFLQRRLICILFAWLKRQHPHNLKKMLIALFFTRWQLLLPNWFDFSQAAAEVYILGRLLVDVEKKKNCISFWMDDAGVSGKRKITPSSWTFSGAFCGRRCCVANAKVACKRAKSQVDWLCCFLPVCSRLYFNVTSLPIA